MPPNIIPAIMAGGRGTRLWPLSRATAAKQFLKLAGEETLFQATLERVSDSTMYGAPLVITNEEYRFLVAEQARELGAELSGIVLEPVPRNTAAAVAVAAQIVGERFGKDAFLFVLPSDHAISVDDAYNSCLHSACLAASDGKLVTFGIQPSGPATGYGYIECGIDLGNGAHAVKRFVEKPSREKASALLECGNYYWNSGMFLFQVGRMIAELEQHAPDVLTAAQAAVEGSTIDADFLRLSLEDFSKAPSISIDYALMEKTANAAVVPSHFSWSDLGSWDAVWKIEEQDLDGNVIKGNATAHNTRNSLVMSRTTHLAVQGLDGVAVIASEDAVFVGRLEEAHEIGNLVKRLAADENTAHLTESHPTSLRPWGGYTTMLSGDRFQVKRLFVHPGKMLSLQKHFHRSEHWVCVKGSAEVTVDDSVTILHENQSIYIPQGSVHRLGNPGKIMLEIIEIQTGSYLGEDDIVRLVDEFGRA
ncbi:mannose-1-phosphate guanylyltransferase/mannose-6-phosphate isomerase [Sinorhizobium alkalisoli]|uniref:mannose-1-phosphate guanylyltransferase n=1 Tax=Sinorhizobium alkalisoli TaxID=1752398 RepID=A0A1E3VJ69_9HYPH|nr:mannose-1-phosphate guanylyltransferase/mannose-6-phosphate isomerase [Sinorhizobium alkalisoli]ODR93076.1 mannose-1-phosphate guanylyltransferase/mannose-6-phosphate isomerase [Sinorhizobium alkalisoli]QFI70840.1 Mannose-1-phosphate guanylyltransferase (GDP) [Sinorhizobium alkalisoli]